MELQEGTPKTSVNIKDMFAGKRGVLFAVPGAFTPGCSNVCVMMHRPVSQHNARGHIML